jgi:cell division protein FtsW
MKKRYDSWILIIVGLLIILGLMAVYSSTSVISPDIAGKVKAPYTQFGYLKKQLFTVLLGLFTMLLAYKVPLRFIRKAAVPLLVLALFCLLLVFTGMGITVNGARRWIRIWPSSFQPSEMVKLCMVVFMAWYMSLDYFKENNFKTFMIPIAVMAFFQVILLKQPDFGAVMSLALLTMSMLFLSGVKLRYLMSLSLLAIPVIVKLVSEPYRMKRIVAFIDPWKDARGGGFQLVQSFIALGSGGLRGVGLGEGKQKLAFLPEIHTDFIFAMIGEELGFIGAFFVIVLFLVLFFRGMNIAQERSDDTFSYYLAFGITMMIGVQAAVNFFVVTGMAPTKGLPLPFISYGGSSLIVNMTAVGLLLNVSGSGPVREMTSPDEESREPLPVSRTFPSSTDRLRRPVWSAYRRYGHGVLRHKRLPGPGR